MLSLFSKKPNQHQRPGTPAPEPAAAPPDLDEVLKGYSLPSFPKMVMQVLRQFKDPNSSLAQIAEQLERDPGMSVRVLKIVNSAAFGVKKNISQVGHAVTLLGPARVEALVVSVAVREILPANVTPYFNGRLFWQLAARRASLARALAEYLHPNTASEAFTAGMLLDLAVPVLVELHQEQYGYIYQKYMQDPQASLPALEQETLGYTHTTVGMMIAKRWELPSYLVDAIGGHHGDMPEVHIDMASRLVADLRLNTRPEELINLVVACEGIRLSNAEIRTLVNQAFADAEVFQRALG